MESVIVVKCGDCSTGLGVGGVSDGGWMVVR